jgi:hypothetical protein
MIWEVSACVDSDGMTLYVIGRGTDLEAAAASAMAVLTANGSTVEATPVEDHSISERPSLHPSATRLVPGSPNLPAAADTLAVG